MFRMAVLVLAGFGACLVGCTGFGNKPRQDPTSFATPGQYSPPPAQNPRWTVGVPEAQLANPTGVVSGIDLGSAASEELVSLVDASRRFNLIEHVRLREMLDSEGDSSMLQPGRLVHPAAVRGVDYLLLAQVQDLSVRKEPDPGKVSVAAMEKLLNVGPGYKPKLIVSGKVGLWLTDPRTGSVVVFGHSDFQRTATPQDLGLEIKPEEIARPAQVSLGAKDTRTILRLILDDALRQMLPRYDLWASEPTLQHHETLAAASSTTRSAGPSTSPTTLPAAFIYCPNCGAPIKGTEEFCPNCGYKLR